MQCDGMGWDQAEPAYEFLSVWGNDLGNAKNWGHNSGTISCVSLDDAELGWAAQGGGCNGRVSLAPASFTSVRFHGPLPGCSKPPFCVTCVNNHTYSLSLSPAHVIIIVAHGGCVVSQAAQWADRPAH